MQRRYLSMYVFLYSLILFSLCNTAFADIEAEFKQAEEYKKMGNYQQAEAVFQSIITNNPGAKEALRAQRQIIYSLLGRNADAQAAIERLLTDFTEQDGWLPALYDIAGRCEERKKYDYAKGIYQKITQKYPSGSAQFNDAQANIAKVDIMPLIDSNNITSAREDVNELITSFAGNAALPDVLYDIGGKYHSAGKFEQARELYERIVAGYPDTKYSLRAQGALARVYIATGKADEAKTAVEKLAADFSDDSQTYQSLLDLARNYASRGQYEQAKDVYRQIAQKWPNSSYANRASFESAKSDIYNFIDKNDEPNTLKAIDKLINGFKEKTELPADVYDFAARVDWKNNYEPKDFTKNICQLVMERFPNTKQAILAQMLSSRLDILSLTDANDDPNAFAAMDTYITDYNDIYESSENLWRIAERYYKRAFQKIVEPNLQQNAKEDFIKSIEVKERIIKDLPVSVYTPRAYSSIGLIYCQELGEFERGIEYLRRLIDKSPDYKGLDFTYYLLGKYLDRLKALKKIEALQADREIENSYRMVVEKYPNSKLIPYTAYSLGKIYYAKGDLTNATRCLETGFQAALDKPKCVETPKIVNLLGQIYERSGEKAIAAQIYQVYLGTLDPNSSMANLVKADIERVEGGER